MRNAGTWHVGVIVLVLVFGPVATFAGRPLDTEDTGTVDPGKAELELSGDFVRNPEENTWFAKGVLSVGLLPRLEARIESALPFVEPEGQSVNGGIGDSLLGAKYRLVDEAPTIPAVLGSLTVRLPTGDDERGLGTEEVDLGLLAVVSKVFGPVTLTWNGGYTFATRNEDLSFWTLAGSVEYRATKEWSLVGEVVSGFGASAADDLAVLRAGTVYVITDRVRLDAAVGVGATRESSDVIVTFGVTIALF
ncbi:MAG: transporter [Candidatus Rokubacteria bacterium]|nr:transporter [Candidatus Rokubacteria bacterium]